MRQLVDEHELPWETAWDLTRQVFAYTCHTLMPEALEKWQMQLFERLLPRHMEIIYEINDDLLQEVCAHFQNDPAREARMSIIEEGPERMIRMANLATAAGFSVNGVAELHSELLKRNVLSDFYELWPEKFNNKTNGVSARRFVCLSNPRLSDLVSSKIGSGWLNDLEQLRGLEPYAEDAGFRQAWREVKRQNKVDLAGIILQTTGISVDPDSMFDVMVKRLHEYKRQLLKALHIITLYQRLKADPKLDLVPRTFIFGAKAAPGYQQAKLIIKLINSIAEVINTDPDTCGKLKVAFLPNFNVTLGEKIYPAADLSEQISLAGKEASGTGNMEVCLNGALIIRHLTVPTSRSASGWERKISSCSAPTAHQVMPRKSAGYNPMDYYNRNRALKAAIDAISSGTFSNGDASLFQPIVNSLLGGDEYMLLADYRGYIKCQADVDRLYRDQENWTRRSILNTARSGYFSSDRAVKQYNDEIWKAQVVRVSL
jgi:starch phosphorylase